MKDFDLEKEEYMDKLYKPDKSKKGDVDKFLISLIDDINETENYFTTSSCSGRISIFTINKENKKNTSNWILVSHEKVTFDQILNSLKDLSSEVVRFKQEPMILHICCRTLENAQNLMYIAHESGLKDSGIISTRKRFILKIVGSDRIDSPIAVEGKLMVSEEYLKWLTSIVNEKLERVHVRIEKLHETFNKKITLRN